MTLPSGEHALLPTDKDVAFYRAHGWYCSKTVLPKSLIDDAITEMYRHFVGDRDWRLPAVSRALVDNTCMSWRHRTPRPGGGPWFSDYLLI